MKLSDLGVGTQIHCADTGWGEKWGHIAEEYAGGYTIVWDRVTPGTHDPEPSYTGQELTYLASDVQRMLARPDEVTFTLPEPPPLDGLIGQVRDGIEREFGDRRTWGIGGGIINIYSKPVPTSGPDGMEQHYLCTVTVTRTP